MSVDNYMNLQVRPALHSVASVPLYHSTICMQLANTEEFQNGNFTGAIGEILIRSVWPLGTRICSILARACARTLLCISVLL